MITRNDIVAVARKYVGTPFHHMGRSPGVGLDCVGVPICVMRELKATAPDFDVPNYAISPEGTALMAWCNESLPPVQKSEIRAGDLIVLIIDKFPQHVGIVGSLPNGELTIIHAAGGANPPRVLETRMAFGKWMRFVAAFSLLESSWVS